MDDQNDSPINPLLDNERQELTANPNQDHLHVRVNEQYTTSDRVQSSRSNKLEKSLHEEHIEDLLGKVNKKIEDHKKEKEQATSTTSYTKILLTYADGTDKFLIALGWFMSIATGIIMPAFVFLFGDIVNQFGDSALDAINKSCLNMVILGVAIWVTSYFNFSCLVIMAERVGRKTKVAYLRALLQQDVAWFDSINVTELPARLSKECQAIQKALGEKMGTILMSLAMSFSGLFFAFYTGWWFSLILIFAFPILLVMTTMITVAMQSGFSQNMISYAQSAGYAEQALNAIRVVSAFGQEEVEMKNYSRFLNKARTTGVKTHFKTALTVGFFILTMFGYYAYAFYTGTILITKPKENTNNDEFYNGGNILTCFFGVVFGVFSLGMAIPNLKAVTEGRVAGKMAYEIIDRIPAIRLDDQGAKNLQDLSGRIEFKNVSFSYPSRKEQKILDNFSATFEEGKTTALVGASGSGKSTIVQMVERFYDPDMGDVTIDGLNLKEVNLRDFRMMIGYVGQEPVLFNTSIKANVLYGKPDATEEEVIEALKSANAYNFITEKLSEGIHTNVGNAGGQLSGGQKQRIAIARAFIKKPKILILDEATSALDKKNEREVQEAIDRIRTELGSITTIVIAHRLSTIKNSDKIIVMKKGKIVEVGNHETLLSDHPEGIYTKFVKEQENAEQNEQQDYDEEEPSPAMQAELKKSERINEDELERKISEARQKIRKSSHQRRSKKNAKLEKIEEQLRNEVDEEEKEQAAGEVKAPTKGEKFSRIFKLTEPKINVAIGISASFVQGGLMPVLGVLIGYILFKLEAYTFVVTLNGVEMSCQFPDNIPTQFTGSFENKCTQLEHQSIMFSLYIFICACTGFVTAFSSKFSFGVTGENVTLKIREQLYSSIIRKEVGWFDDKENTPGVLSATMASDAQVINGVSSEGLASQIEAGCSLIVAIIIAFIFYWQISLVCLACVPFMILGGVMNVKFQAGLSQDNEAAQKEADMLAGDAIANYRTVASFGTEEQIINDYSAMLYANYPKITKQAHIMGFVFGFSQFVQYAVFAVFFYAGGQFMEHLGASPTDIFVAMFSMMFGAMAAGQASQFGPDLGKANAAADKIFKITDKKSSIDPLNSKELNQRDLILNENFRGEIEFKNVWFRYPTRKQDWVLKGLNMKIRQNETVALVGESGCGKSTIVSLLLRFYDINRGHIFLDGIDIREYKISHLRAAMGLVMQEPTLFNYTIYENILYGKNECLNSEIYESAKIANALEFIQGQEIQNAVEDASDALFSELQSYRQNLVDKIGINEFDSKRDYLQKIVKEDEKKGKFQTQEGDIDYRTIDYKDVDLSHGFHISCGIKGSKLSGGQKQRIAIARAVIRKPQILILDEATSALDEESQRKVQVALENIMENRTSIVIAHRLSTVEKCDRILVLESGTLIEEGGFQELKQKEGGVFAELASGMQNKN